MAVSSSVVKCNLSSRSLLVHHKTTKDMSVVSKTESSQEMKMRSPVCVEHRLFLLRKARQISRILKKS